MIQRIQSLFLLLAAGVSLGLTSVFSLWSDENGSATYVMQLFKSEEPLLIVIPVIFLLSGFLSLLSLLNYKKRINQFMLNRVNILINLILLGVLIYYLLTLPGGATAAEKGIGVLLPLITIVLLAMANKSIKRDEDLVKSVDRLR